MTQNTGTPQKDQKQREAEERQKRLADNLRANLRRRKQQSRDRSSEDKA